MSDKLSDKEWGQNCGTDGMRACTLHNLHCGYPNCPKGKKDKSQQGKMNENRDAERTAIERMSKIYMDWEQVRQNGGPPCFALGIDGNPFRCCGRAKRWEGHDSNHAYMSLQDFALSEIARVGRDR